MTPYCEIRPGGQLIYRRWRTPDDDDDGEGLWVEANHTGVAFRHLYTRCVLADGVTLRDVFLLLDANLEMFDTILGNWCKEIVAEGLSPLRDDQKPTDLHYLEVYWHLTVEKEWDVKGDRETGKTEISGHHFPRIHGFGPPWEGSGSNDPMPWGIDFQPANVLIDLPIRLKGEFTIVDEAAHYEQSKPGNVDWSKTIKVYEASTYTLGHILQAIIWEMSFYGNPSDRDGFSEELSRRVKAVESGKEETYPLEEVMDRLAERLGTDKAEEE